MIDFTDGNRRFHMRVAGVLEREGCVLLHSLEEADYWILPGGRVELGETSISALKREMREELGQDVNVGRLLWIAESLLQLDGFQLHGIGLYYAISLIDDARFLALGDTLEVRDGGVRLTFAWHRLECLDEITIYPPFLREG